IAATTGRCGYANFAAAAYGIAGPIVARLPDSDAIMPDRTLRSRAHHPAQVPESAVRIALSGSRGESSQNTRCGLIGSADSIARRSITFHQSATQPAMSSRQL